MVSFDRRSTRFMTAILAVILIATGCASYETKKMPAMAEVRGARGEVTARDGSLEVHAVPMLDKETANTYLGIDPSATGMAPILFKIRNNGAGPVKIDMSRSYLSSKSDERSSCLSLDEACTRARSSDAEVVGWGVAFGVVGMMASSSKVTEANLALENDYQRKQFKPTLINTGGVGEGVLFFDVPKDKQPSIRSAVIAYLDLSVNESREITLDFSGPGSKAE